MEVVPEQTPRRRGIIRALWNGPFALGPLKQGASLGAVLAKILEVTWKVGIAFIIVAAIAIASTLLFERLESSPPSDDDMELAVRVADAGCPSDLPFGVTATNTASKAVMSMSYDFAAYEAGRSSNIAASGPMERLYQWKHDFIIQPDETFSWCIPAPELTRVPQDDVTWHAWATNVVFEE